MTCETCARLTAERDELDRLWWMYAGWNMPMLAGDTMARLHDARVNLARHKAECEKETK